MSETTNFEAAAYTALGTPRDRVALPGATFDGTVNLPVMHQAVKAYLANQRQGTHATKTRRWVVGGNQKPWKQKGTGRARQGSTRAPHFVGGGTVFGPQPRSYEQTLPKGVKTLARKSALNARAREGALLVIDRFAFEKPKTTQVAQLLARLELLGRKVLILTDGHQPMVYLSGRNIPNVRISAYSDVTTYDVVWSDVVLVEAGAIGQALAPVTESAAPVKVKKAPAKAKAPKAEAKGAKAAPAKKAPAKQAAAKAAAKPVAKAAAKKAPAKKAAKKKGE